MKTLILLASLFLVQEVIAEPIVWNGKFYPNKQVAEKNHLIPSYLRPVAALAIEISKAKKYFVGYDALVWQKRNILKQHDNVHGKLLMARQLNNSEATFHYRTVKENLKLQLSWINEQL